MQTIQKFEHSAAVQIWLEVDSLCLGVAQVGESSLVLADSSESAVFDMALLAYLITIIDGATQVFRITLRRRNGRVIEFEGCECLADDTRELDTVPF